MLTFQFLDCGLVVEIGPEQHGNMVKILGAFVRNEPAIAARMMVDTNSEWQASPFDVDLFVKGVEAITQKDKEQNFLENIGDYIADICYLACKRSVKLEATFINAALAIEIMEGIASALNPDIKVATVALPIVQKAELMHAINFSQLWSKFGWSESSSK
jgi:aarF domain-containing kinase